MKTIAVVLENGFEEIEAVCLSVPVSGVNL